MILDVKKAGITYYGISEDDAKNKGILSEYNSEKNKVLHDEAIQHRRGAYLLESDPLYMEWQYDQTPEKEKAWRDKVAEIKVRYPLPSES